MKFRTDFVTNSSSVCYALSFKAEHPVLAQKLRELGIEIGDSFDEDTRFRLPSGKTRAIDLIKGKDDPYYDAPYFYKTPGDSISSWLVNGLFQGGYSPNSNYRQGWKEEVRRCEDEEVASRIIEANEELLEILGDQDFSGYDADIVSFFYEYHNAEDGEPIDHFERIIIEKGKRLDYKIYGYPDITGKTVYVFPFRCVVFASKEEIEEKVREHGGKPVEDLASAEIAVVDRYSSSAFRQVIEEDSVRVVLSEKAFAVSLCDDSGWPSRIDQLRESWGDYWQDLCDLFMDELDEKYGLFCVTIKPVESAT